MAMNFAPMKKCDTLQMLLILYYMYICAPKTGLALQMFGCGA